MLGNDLKKFLAKSIKSSLPLKINIVKYYTNVSMSAINSMTKIPPLTTKEILLKSDNYP